VAVIDTTFFQGQKTWLDFIITCINVLHETHDITVMNDMKTCGGLTEILIRPF